MTKEPQLPAVQKVQLPARQKPQLPARRNPGGPPAPRPRSETALVKARNKNQTTLMRKMYGDSVAEMIPHMTATFDQIAKMEEEALCSHARAIRSMAAEAGFEDNSTIIEMLEAIRQRMYYLWTEKHGHSYDRRARAYRHETDQRDKKNNLRERKENKFESALGHRLGKRITGPKKDVGYIHPKFSASYDKRALFVVVSTFGTSLLGMTFGGFIGLVASGIDGMIGGIIAGGFLCVFPGFLISIFLIMLGTLLFDED